MHTSPRVWNSSHIVEEAPHLGKGQWLVGFDRTPTGVHEGDVIFLALERLQRTTVLGKVLKKVEEERAHLLTIQQLG